MTKATNDLYPGRREKLGDLTLLASGKVRDLYAVDEEHLLFVTSDRVSAFDVIMPRCIPNKGRVLTKIATHWFQETCAIVPNHLVSTDPDDVAGLDAATREELLGRIMLVRRARPTTVEWVVRQYLAGSGWKEYQATGTVCGIELEPGLDLASKLSRPILTPTTKDEAKDRPLSPAEAAQRMPQGEYERAERIAFQLFDHGARALAQHGILLADTKFEFGYLDDELVLIDEALTPDSSRFWDAAAWQPGSSPKSYDKQILRDHLETLDWNKQPPGPELGDEILERVEASYIDICRTLTGALPDGVNA